MIRFFKKLFYLKTMIYRLRWESYHSESLVAMHESNEKVNCNTTRKEHALMVAEFNDILGPWATWKLCPNPRTYNDLDLPSAIEPH